MLEYEFTSLDDDFITLWSKFTLTGDENVILSDLEKLAELGQVNAVQTWYLFRNAGENERIDAIVKSYRGNSYNELHALSNYYKTVKQEQDKVLELLKKVRDLEEENKGLTGWRSEKCYEEIKDTLAEIRKTPALSYLKQAIDLAVEVGNESSNPYIMERATELMDTYKMLTPIRSDSTSYDEEVTRNYKVARRYLLNKLKERKKNNPYLKPSIAPQIFYYLSRNLQFSQKNSKRATEYISELSKREYSSKLKNLLGNDSQKILAWNALGVATPEEMKKMGYNTDTIKKVLALRAIINQEFAEL